MSARPTENRSKTRRKKAVEATSGLSAVALRLGPLPPNPRTTVYVVYRGQLPPVFFESKRLAQECRNSWIASDRHARMYVYTHTGEQT
jgi:hypothetical protein